MNVVWLIILISGTATMLFVDPDGAVRAMLNGSSGAVTLSLTLIATYGFWLGFFALLDAVGVSDLIARLLRPLVKKLFGNVSPETEKYITCNMSANLLGLGNASTPMGIKAICSMYENKNYASTNMIMLLVISATSLQLIPSTVIGMRISHGSASPTAFLPACIAATVASTVAGVLLVKLLSRVLGPEPRAPLFRPEPRRGKTKPSTEALLVGSKMARAEKFSTGGNKTAMAKNFSTGETGKSSTGRARSTNRQRNLKGGRL